MNSKEEKNLAIRAKLEAIGFQNTQEKPLVYRKRVGSGRLFVDLRYGRKYYFDVRIPADLFVLCNELVQLNRSGLIYTFDWRNGPYPLEVQIITDHMIDGYCVKCRKDMAESIPWDKIERCEPDEVRGITTLCPQCNTSDLSQERQDRERAEKRWKKFEERGKKERKKLEHSKKMSEEIRDAEAEEKRLREEREDRGYGKPEE